MNEPRTLWRYCVSCGQGFEVQLSGKKHWWNHREILTDCFYGGKMDLRLNRGWFSKWLPFDYKPKSLLDRFLSHLFWWWTPREAECSMSNWKKPFWMVWWKIEDLLDPPELIEYWECPICLKSLDDEGVK